jgi:hypothetical protein
VSPVKYELCFISQKTEFFIVTAVKTSNVTYSIAIVMRFSKLHNRDNKEVVT